MGQNLAVQWKQWNGTDYDNLYPVIADGSVTPQKLSDNFTLPWNKITGTNPFAPSGQIILTSSCYGTTLPSTATDGRLFFKKVQ